MVHRQLELLDVLGIAYMIYASVCSPLIPPPPVILTGKLQKRQQEAKSEEKSSMMKRRVLTPQAQ